MTPGRPVMISRGLSMYPPGYLESLQSKKQVVARLCSALHEFLVFDIDSTIEQASRPVPKRPKPTIEDLNRAQEQLDLAQNALTAIENTCADMPEKLGEMLRLTQSPQVRRWIDQAQEQVSFIQAAMEEPDSESADPWAGISLVTMCVKCAAVSPPDVRATHPKEMNLLLIDAGWRRDEDGDLMCPQCASLASTEPPSPIAAPSTAERATDSGIKAERAWFKGGMAPREEDGQ